MKAQNEILGQVSGPPENEGLASDALRESMTRHVGDEVEDGPQFETPSGRNVIVAIGINQYQHQPQLDNPINDARAVLALFKQCGFQELPGVPSLIADDATRAAIADLPNRLATELTPDDNLVIFFAGHGDKVEREAPDPAEPGKTYTHRTGYLIPVDGPKDKPGEWIKLDGFLDDLSGLPARHIFVILDACKSGIALADKFKVRGGDQPTTVAALRRLPSRRVMTSAMHDEKAAEGGSGSGHSLFAEALITAIQDRKADRDGDGYIKTVDLFSFVQDHVSDRAEKLVKLKQTPDYGYLPGDGGGDLVISLCEGAFNRLIEEALGAMLRHDVPRLEGLVDQLIAANPTYSVTLYLQFRLKFMQGDIVAATQIVTQLSDENLPPGTLPLSLNELTALSSDLRYWSSALAMPAGNPPIRITMLTGRKDEELHSAPLIPTHVGDAYQLEKDARAQFQVTNLGTAPVHLYYIVIAPTGRVKIGPLLHPLKPEGLAPHDSGVGPLFEVKGLPGTINETRIYCSPQMIPEMLSPPHGTRVGPNLDAAVFNHVQVRTVWDQIPEEGIAGPTDVQTILSAYVW